MIMGDRQIYVVLTDTGTWFSQIIKLYTGHPLNHSSIALDSDLTELYSFGRKHRLNPISAGFVRERVVGDLIRSPQRPTNCAIYSCTINESTYKQIYSRIQFMDRNRELYRYNLLGVVGLAFRIRIARKNAFFCSQFVASLFQEHGERLLDKDADYTIPDDFRHCMKLELVYFGDLREATQVGAMRRKVVAPASSI